MSRAVYIIEDARRLEEVYKRHIRRSADLILTSPPYFNIINYENAKHQIGQNQTYEAYIDDVANVLQQCYKVSKDSATLWVVVDTIRLKKVTVPLPFDINEALNRRFGDHTWRLRDIIIWNKGKNIPWHSKGRFKKQFEYVLFFSKNDNFKFRLDGVREIVSEKKWWLSYPERYNSNGNAPSNIWEFTIPIRGWGCGYQSHLCPFPFPLIERILKISSVKRNLVLDPFAGSGSVLALAKQMGRDSVGFDIVSQYKKKYEGEVLLGAKKYWAKREKVQAEEKKLLKEFKVLNIKLRKIKACLRLIETSNDKRKARFIPILLDQGLKSNKVRFFYIGKMPEGDKRRLREKAENELKNIMSEFKINIDLSFKTIHEFSTMNRIKTLYRYSSDKIYRYTDVQSVHDIVSSNRMPYNNSLYSNIKLCIER